MKRKLYILFSLFVLASMVLGACANEPTTPVPQPTQAPTRFPTPVADIQINFREDFYPQIEGQEKVPVLWVSLLPGEFGENVSVKLILSDGTVFALEPNPEETPLDGLIGGSQLEDSIIESSDGVVYQFDCVFRFSAYYKKQ